LLYLTTVNVKNGQYRKRWVANITSPECYLEAMAKLTNYDIAFTRKEQDKAPYY